jgi:uncharacterized membrane protein
MADEPVTPKPEKPSPFEAAEWRDLLVALVFATATLFAIGALFQKDAHTATTLLSSVGMHVAGARAPAILFCLVRGLSPGWTLFFNFYIEVLIVFVVYYAFILVVREGLEAKILHIAAKQAEAAAQRHRTLLKRFELLGLFFLVMAPFPMTGPVSGALIGYLLNLRPWVTFSVVLSGTFVALAAYVALGQTILTQIIEFQKTYQDTANIVLLAVIAAFTIFHVKTIRRWVEETVSNDSGKDA